MAVIAGLSGYPGMRGAMNEPTVAHFLHWTCLVKGEQVGFMRCASSFQSSVTAKGHNDRSYTDDMLATDDDMIHDYTAVSGNNAPGVKQRQTTGISCAMAAKDDDALNSTGPDSSAETTVTTVSTPTPATPQSEHFMLSKPVVGNTQSGKSEASRNLDNYIGVGVLRKRNGSYDNGSTAPVEPDNFPASEIAALERHYWIWTETIEFAENQPWCGVRVYVLPDDVGRKSIPRSSTALRRALKVVMMRIDRSDEVWNGSVYVDQKAADNPVGSLEDESLWYIFNTLQDPKPQLDTHGEEESGQDYSGVLGLKTPLYPYQRRSAATMVQREAQPAQVLDPRLQAFKSPRGEDYYYDKEEGSIFREKKMYSEACGGILAETMGCGKTLICLAVILATRGHFPEIPLEYQEMKNPIRQVTGSLVEMAAATAGRFSLPWKTHFDTLGYYGTFYERCVMECERHRGAYTIPPPPARHKGRSGVAYPRPPPQKIRLCSGTLIIVPPNLVNHWHNEISAHTDGLKVLVLRNSSDKTPSPDELLQYDIVLFSRIRFEKEAGEVVNNRRISFTPEESPLTKLHWLRIIVDEGHNVAGSGNRTTMMHILSQLHIERRWIVSGTPSSGLYGVEVSLASQETHTSETDLTEATTTVLRGRKKTGNALDSELKDLDKLRYIVIDFLDLKPWSNPRTSDPANWTKYIKPIGEDGRRRKAQSLRATLQSLVVRHRLEVIHSEIPLPRLHNKVVHLEPTFYDKLNLNMFIFGLAVNAVTSERTDQDYMFHARNRKHLSTVINNLRQAGFWWAGSDEIAPTIDVALKYLELRGDKTSKEDIETLREGIRIAQKAQASGCWRAFKRMHELGVFIQDFPEHARSMWAIDSSVAHQEPLLLGITQARHAQKFVTKHLNTYDPAEGLAGAGIKVRRELSGREGDNLSPKKTTPDKPVKSNSPKKTYTKGLFKTLPEESPLTQTKLVATASAKLTYLLDQVSELHKTEKIIIFYDNNNAAFWIAEGLELLGIDFRIYASTLKPTMRAEYLALFRESEEVRVLLMDLRQASHGLHIANASRVFIVNPIWQPNVESQAIKRAHRIGQTRPVFVETLVLKDTLEDKMLKRRKAMTDSEIHHAERDLLDDSTMSSIIQNERYIPMPETEDSSFTRGAFLKHPTGLFDRHKLAVADDEKEGITSRPGLPDHSSTPRKRKHVRTVDIDESTDEPDLVTPKRRKSTSPGLGFLSPQGILMTPPRTWSRSPRASPFPVVETDSAHASTDGAEAGKKKRVSLFGGACPD
ncbi:SNF2 family helicase [Aspergillus niger]|uniref:SNF2 family helicase n=1 Tax=Aspergillus niger TaxID=5061 RepID=A0A100IB69_ASPNG|nr:SNF2 family helicase [Aspergillus niger]